MDRIKCPNCGDTERITYLQSLNNYFYSGSKEYECGCGCLFEIIPESVTINIQAMPGMCPYCGEKLENYESMSERVE
jgi:sarcosine oxidase delta subunit